MSKRDLVEVIITGGTIDSVWDGSKDTAVVNNHSDLPEYFKRLSRNLKFYENFVFSEVCMKDSRQITDDDRQKVVDTIDNSKANKFLVTHGTYTMPNTARYIQKKLKRKDVAVVLTGSMVPMTGFDFSDGPFNLGYAISQLQVLSAGIYVCMNARVFNAGEVAKNTDEGKFYSVFKDEQ